MNEEGSQQPLPEEREPVVLTPVEGDAREPKRRLTHGVIDLIIGVALLWAFVGVVFAIWVLVTAGVGEPEKIEELLMTPGVFVVTQILVFGWMFLVTWFFVCARYRLSFTEGFQVKPVGLGALVASVAIGVISAGGAMVVMHYFSTGESTMAKLVSTEEGLLAVSVVALLAPLFEEMYYRGFIFPVLREKLGATAAVTIVSLWFCVAHVFQLAGDWAGVPVILAMGFIWTVQRHRYDSLTPPIITHLTYNAGLIASAYFSF